MQLKESKQVISLWRLENNLFVNDDFFNKNLYGFVTSKNIGDCTKIDIIKNLFQTLNLNVNNLVTCNQIHSGYVEFLSSKNLSLKCDGLITNKPGLILGIFIADCVPIFIFDKKNKIVALIHAGKKGILKGIVENAVKAFTNLGSNIKNLKILLGPHIKSCCYEVSNEVRDIFKDAIELRNGKIFLNLQKEIIIRLNLFNITDVEGCDICSFCNPNLFSYRKGNLSERMLAVVMLYSR